MNIKSLTRIWGKVFSNWKYFISLVVIASLFYSFNVAINSWSSLISFYSSFGFFGTMKFFLVLALGFKDTIKFHSYISLVIVSLLLGILFSLVAYKVSLGSVSNSNGVGIFGTVGVFLAALAPGCAACGIGLVSALGLSSAFLTFFPLEGLELSILAIGILSFSIYKVTNDMKECKVCQIKFNNQKVKGGKKNE